MIAIPVITRKFKIAFIVGAVLFILAVVLAGIAYLLSHNTGILDPQGVMARSERNLILTATLLMLVVVIPVFVLTVFVAVRYRDTNTKAKYEPNWDHSLKLELLWWAIPGAIIAILAVITWKSSHDLDPFRPLASSQKPLTVQVVALDWKWLFIYPEQGIASVNRLVLPQGRPVTFDITSDAPMNSFWIPQLSGQIYAMPGMSTQLHLQADHTGSYYGESANISGRGFAGMHFQTDVLTATDFSHWTGQTQSAPQVLDPQTYDLLAKPSQNNPVTYYSPAQPGLYDEIVMKYMSPTPEMPEMSGMNMSGMNMP